ncbi:hypothetical protein HF563_19440 [Acidithiobacillus ferridurans]|nr:hypothetical protein [Acidithiobacillus ferridurans]
MATKVKQKPIDTTTQPSGGELQVIPAKPGRKKTITTVPCDIGGMITAAVDEGFMHTPSRAATHDLIAMATYSLQIHDRDQEKRYRIALEQIRMLDPRDGMEAQIATMMVSTMQCALETLQRSTAPGQHADVARHQRNSATRLVRTYAELADLLDRHRNKGTQKIVVQHQTVMVNGDAQVAQITGKGETGHE